MVALAVSADSRAGNLADSDDKLYVEDLEVLHADVLEHVRVLWSKANIQDPAHNIAHITAVTDHVKCAIATEPQGRHRNMLVVLAAILHEADDSKLFPESDGSTNTRRILEEVLPPGQHRRSVMDEIVEIIDLVSARKNKHAGVAAGSEWKLLVRDADRIEAIGEVGIARCYAYNRKVDKPLFLDSTPRATTEEELWKIATPERFASYTDSVSMIDHYYDKLLHLQKCSSGSAYMEALMKERLQILIDFVLDFGLRGRVNEPELQALQAKWCPGKKKRGPEDTEGAVPEAKGQKVAAEQSCSARGPSVSEGEA
eukprot:TRINITY_DN88036_c0_g1_i1.p1 TRINITY_DN88036_c0_g1~~TRINITY_DN88036_c0_g1_i1.p1  ORF type:complete len:313 (+),score=62.61 TRINITY_DN88036_c0_g1_i1:73-1011(+)